MRYAITVHKSLNDKNLLRYFGLLSKIALPVCMLQYYDLELILLEHQADFSSIMYVIIVSAFFTEFSSTVVFQSAMFEQSSFIRALYCLF